MRRAAPAIVGAVLFAIAVGACIRTGIRERDRIGDALGSAEPAWLLAGLVAAGVSMVVVATGWSRTLALLGPRPAAARVCRWYFVGELGKYVPGALWPILGRGELAHRGGIERSTAYRSVGLSLIAWYGAALLPAALVVSHPRVQRAAAGLAARASRGRVDVRVLPWGGLVRLVLTYVPAWLLVGATTAAVLRAFGEPVGWQAPAAAVLAWVCGFLAVPVPAGAGVREAVFVATSGLDSGLALTVAVTTRLAFLLVDLVGAAVSAPVLSARGEAVSPR